MISRTIAIAVILCSISVPGARAQERVPREQCMKIACMIGTDLKQMLDTPIPTDPDLKRPVAVSREDRGVMVLPECKLSADAIARAGTSPVPVGQLWLRRVSPMRDGLTATPDELKLLTVGPDDQPRTAILCALAVRRNASGKLELLIYGKSKTPLVTAPLKELDSPARPDEPIDVSAQVAVDTADITLDILGRYRATFAVGGIETE